MGNKIANRAVICEKLQEFAKTDQKICIVTSDSRGSASLTPFTKEFPDRVIEVGWNCSRFSCCRNETVCCITGLFFNNAFD